LQNIKGNKKRKRKIEKKKEEVEERNQTSHLYNNKLISKDLEWLEDYLV
jgi:hypothetical protein